MSQPRILLISSYFFHNGTIITKLLLFYLDLRLVWEKFYHFVQNILKKSFKKFVETAVNARREGNENPNSSVITETMKFLANNSYGYQIMDWCRHKGKKILSDEETHGAINSKQFKRVGYIDNQLYEMEVVKSKYEQKETISVGFFILQYAKLRMLELYYRFFDKYCNVTKFEKPEIDTDSFYLALSENDLYDRIRPAMKKVWNSLQSEDCTDEFSANSKTIFPLTSCAKHKKHDRLELGLFKEKFFCTEMICSCSITFCCNYSQLNNFTFSSEKLRKRTLEDSGDGPISKYRKVLEEVIIVTSTN